jgi:hypothetical protein
MWIASGFNNVPMETGKQSQMVRVNAAPPRAACLFPLPIGRGQMLILYLNSGVNAIIGRWGPSLA